MSNRHTAASRVFTLTIASAALAAAAGVATPSAAQVALDAQAFCREKHPNSVGRVTYGTRGPRVTCNVPGSTGFNGAPVHYSVGEACQALTGDSGTIVDSGVFCRTNPNRLTTLTGRWRLMSRIYIVNRFQCGRVRYFSTIVVTRQVGPNTWVGVNRFRWDTSGLRPGCFFRKPRTGVVRVRLTRSGNTITIQYAQNGVHRFATDHLQIFESRGYHAMRGRDLAGQWVVYQKT